MKKIEAITRPFRLDDIKDKLSEVGVFDISITDIRSSLAREENKTTYLDEDMVVEFLPKIKIEILLDAADEEKAIGAIKSALNDEELAELRIYSIDIVLS